jgi:carbon storage regulator CsrA
MLVLSRKADEEIVIGRAIRVKVLEIRRGRVRIGVSAPRKTEIRRAELTPTNAPDGSESREDEIANVVAQDTRH